MKGARGEGVHGAEVAAHDLRALKRLGDEVVGPLFHGLDRILHGAVRAHHHDFSLRRDGLRRELVRATYTLVYPQ